MSKSTECKQMLVKAFPSTPVSKWKRVLKRKNSDGSTDRLFNYYGKPLSNSMTILITEINGELIIVDRDEVTVDHTKCIPNYLNEDDEEVPMNAPKGGLGLFWIDRAWDSTEEVVVYAGPRDPDPEEESNHFISDGDCEEIREFLTNEFELYPIDVGAAENMHIISVDPEPHDESIRLIETWFVKRGFVYQQS